MKSLSSRKEDFKILDIQELKVTEMGDNGMKDEEKKLKINKYKNLSAKWGLQLCSSVSRKRKFEFLVCNKSQIFGGYK